MEQQQQQVAAAVAAAAAAAAAASAQQQAQQQRKCKKNLKCFGYGRKICNVVCSAVDGTSSATLSSLQSCVGSSVQAANLRGPEISPKLAKYFRADLIAHVTNWHAEVLERQVSCEVGFFHHHWKHSPSIRPLIVHSFEGAEVLRGHALVWRHHLHEDLRGTEVRP